VSSSPNSTDDPPEPTLGYAGSRTGHVHSGQQSPSRAQRPALLPGLIASALLLVAIVPIPEYGYYIFLRLAVTTAAVFVAVLASRTKQTGWLVFGIMAALIFNPFIPIWLSKSAWMPIDLIGAVMFGIAAFAVRHN
jgi:hypothetical protein